MNMASSKPKTREQATQIDEEELLLNGMCTPAEFVKKGDFTYKYVREDYWAAHYVCTASDDGCKHRAYYIKRNGVLLTRGPAHNHE